MKPKKTKYPLPKESGYWRANEAAPTALAVEISVRAAKDRLSSLLERASHGEEIVITSDGKPKAMIVRYRPKITGMPARALAALRKSMPMTPDSTGMIRQMRDSGH
jgi:prevent-host-death family protein